MLKFYINMKYPINSCLDCLSLSGGYTVCISRFPLARSKVPFCILVCVFPLSSHDRQEETHIWLMTYFYKMQKDEQNGHSTIFFYISSNNKNTNSSSRNGKYLKKLKKVLCYFKKLSYHRMIMKIRQSESLYQLIRCNQLINHI